MMLYVTILKIQRYIIQRQNVQAVQIRRKSQQLQR